LLVVGVLVLVLKVILFYSIDHILMLLPKTMFKLLLIMSLLLLLLLRKSESLQFLTSSRRAFFVETTTFVVVGGSIATSEAADAAIDVSGLRVDQPVVTRGQAPSNLKSGPLAGTKLGFQVGGGPRSEEEVRRIDEPRYAAVRKAQGLGPLWLESVPIEQQPTQQLGTAKR
jgi:hypothetical protein